ncbi:MarR family winged helix-turn-helix transcriptional regulator [Denitromonas sp.]|uniref:MarR family winged helix-turn-helix transcriptional regulator n=1 Tax=Denitromonas sp. TaxID=2734609 RepID=UPI003A85F301
MSSPPTKADIERLSHFRYRLRCYLRASEDLCQAAGVTLLQYQLLLHVLGFPGREWASIGEIAERLQAKHHGVVALVDRCEKLGLVQRRASQADRRLVEVHLLPKGRELVAALADAHRTERELLQQEFSLPGWR